MTSRRAVLTPPGLLLLPLLASLAMWAFPWGESVRTGFYTRAELSRSGAVVLMVWYTSAGTAAWLGYRLGRVTPILASLDRVPSGVYYRYFTLLAVVGVSYTYFYVYRQNPGLLLESFRSATFNNVRSTLPYDSGIHTLRYASTVSGAFAIINIGRSRRATPLDLLNVAALLATAAVSSRLSLMLAALIIIAVASREVRFKSAGRTILLASLGGISLFLALTAANYYRNANFYSERYHQDNPFTASWFEMVTYLAAPFNAAVATASHSAELSSIESSRLPANAAQYVVPTYVPLANQRSVGDQDRYKDFVDMEPSLTTNSALASMYSSLGVVAFALMPMVLFLAALFVGHALNYQSRFYVSGFIVSYCFAEFWRVYLFNAGVVHFLVIAFLATPVIFPSGKRQVGTLGAPALRELAAQVNHPRA